MVLSFNLSIRLTHLKFQINYKNFSLKSKFYNSIFCIVNTLTKLLYALNGLTICFLFVTIKLKCIRFSIKIPDSIRLGYSRTTVQMLTFTMRKIIDRLVKILVWEWVYLIKIQGNLKIL